MAETSTVIGGVAAFVAIAIMLGIGIQILGQTNSSLECGSLKFANGTNNTAWQTACANANTSTQTSYALLIVILIVTAAATILFVVRLL